MKTKKIAAKRFRVTKTGKVLHRTQGLRHLRRKKSKSRKRRQNRMNELTAVRFTRGIKRLLRL